MKQFRKRVLIEGLEVYLHSSVPGEATKSEVEEARKFAQMVKESTKK